MAVIKEELQEIASQYGDDRRTQIVQEEEAVAATPIEEI